MSNAEEINDDLINFNANSPTPTVITSREDEEVIENSSDNLLDTELPELEQKLQTSSHFPPPRSHSRSNSVDIEDILITIEDDYTTSDNSGIRDESSCEIYCSSEENSTNRDIESEVEEEEEDDEVSRQEFENAKDKSFSSENIEAFRILDSLDEILNAHLLQESTDQGDCHDRGCDCIDVNTQQSIEDCLSELDDFLRSFDSSCESDEEIENDVQEITNDTLKVPQQFSVEASSGENSKASSPQRTDSKASLRMKLRRIEENYTRYLSLGRVNNQGYLSNVNNEETKSRSLSSCCKRSEDWHQIRSQFVDALATLPTRRKRRTSVLKSSLVDPGYVESTEIKDVQSERRAHASGDCCTGTVVVEAHRETQDRNSCSVDGEQPVAVQMVHVEPKNDCDDVSGRRRLTSTWLRSSMRHLRHLRLPSDGAGGTRNEEEGSNPNSPDTENNEPPIPNPSALTPETDQTTTRPYSAPSRLSHSDSVAFSTIGSRSRTSRNSAVSLEPGGHLQGGRSSSASSASRRQRSLSSSDSSLASSLETTRTTSSVNNNHHNHHQANQRGRGNGADTRSYRPCDRPRNNDMPEASSPLGQWPHSLSSTLACLSCTLGLFNISRFATLTVHFGSNFILQFIILSIFFGLPLFTLQMCLGQQLGAGVIDMWRISPLFQGVGVSLFLAQALIGVYSVIGVSWMFVFFRDSFITRTDKYKWTEPFIYYRNGHFAALNNSQKLQETIPDYFNGVVLQRHHLSSGVEHGTIKFQMAFNLAVVWMIVFVSLSKGLRSYGKVIYVFTLVPVFGMFILCAKLVGMMPPNFMNNIFPETSWDEFFLNSRSWLAAAQETFLTWGLLGAAVMQITSHNKEKHLLQRDSSLVAVLTFIILILVAFLANTCVQILRAAGYNYVPSSFERMNSYIFLRPQSEPLPTSLGNTPIRFMVHNSFILGEKVARPFMDPTIESGYQVLRFGTELIPATFAVLGSERVSSFWAVLFYFILILFGIAQQLAIWHSVITGIMAIRAKVLKSWETTITFFSCSFGFLLGLPMATELGIYVVYVLDYTVGGIWWLLIIIFLQIVAVFMVRGRPYSGDNVVTALFNSNGQSCITGWIPHLLSFIWNVILPVVLVVLCISTFKNGHFREMFVWHHAPVAEYWPLVVRQIGSLLQLLPILCVPIVAVIQSYRYLNNGPSDILERIQLLYRPPIGDHMDDLTIQEAAAASRMNNNLNNILSEDPPPKYTPPPSYTTATGARLAKFLRQSIRRSVRRLTNVLGESSNVRQRAPIAQTQLPPPDYSTVLVEMNQTVPTITDTPVTVVDGPALPENIRISTLERLRTLTPLAGGSPVITAAEVACILRSSFRRSTMRRNRNIGRVNYVVDNQFPDNSVASLSAENLIDSVAPIGETSLVLDHLPNLNSDENEDKTTTVI